MLEHKQVSDPVCDDQDCGPGRRNRYFLGKRMKPRAFELEQRYHIERRRLLNRAMHGWGVVFGYALGAPTKRGELPVGKGLALDRQGRELLQEAARNLSMADVYLSPQDRKWLQQNRDSPHERNGGVRVAEPVRAATVGETGTPHQHDDLQPGHDTAPTDQSAPEQCDNDTPAPPTCWLLRLHYAEKLDAPIQIKDPCHCDRSEWDTLCETVRYSLSRIDCDACHTCAEPCALCCDCTDDCVDDCVDQPGPFDRGTHRCLCEHLTNFDPDPDHDELCQVVKGLWVDLHNGVPLGCVALGWNDCGDPEFGSVVDACGPRRLVKRNDLLFDLIRGCDLTRISRISWEAWHRRLEPVEWNDFAAYFNEETGATQFTVTFTGPVQSDTVTVDCFAMTVVISEDFAGWGAVMRMPVINVALESDASDPPGSTRRVSLMVDAKWVRDEISNTRSGFRDGPALVEIEVRGDLILDCCGQAVDANAIGRRAPPTGNGTPGGSFLSAFRVAPMPPSYPIR